MIAAVLTRKPHGWTVRLSNYGMQVDHLAVPVNDGQEPTDAAAQVLAEYGWTITDPWTMPTLDGWVAYVEYQPDQEAA